MLLDMEITVANLIDNIDDIISDANMEIGVMGVKFLREVMIEKDLEATTRLSKSWSWATNKIASDTSQDSVIRPRAKRTVNIGTKVPYAALVDIGYPKLVLGSDGNPSTFNGMVDNIIKWAEAKGIDMGENPTAFARSVVRSLIAHGHEGAEYWEPFVKHMESKATGALSNALREGMVKKAAGSRNHKTQKIQVG